MSSRVAPLDSAMHFQTPLPFALTQLQSEIPIEKAKTRKDAVEGEKGWQNQGIPAPPVNPNEGRGGQQQPHGNQFSAARPYRTGLQAPAAVGMGNDQQRR